MHVDVPRFIAGGRCAGVVAIGYWMRMASYYNEVVTDDYVMWQLIGVTDTIDSSTNHFIREIYLGVYECLY